MSHPIHRITSCVPVGSFTLRIGFDDGVQRVIDFSPVLAGQLFGPLRDEQVFRQFRIDPDGHTITWPNGADFDPATLHDWPDHLPGLMELARRWNSG